MSTTSRATIHGGASYFELRRKNTRSRRRAHRRQRRARDARKSGPGSRGSVREWQAGGIRLAAALQTDVSGLLHGGENSIWVVVANLAVNELSKGPLPDYKDLNKKYGERFQPQDMDNLHSQPAGLLGPVRLLAQ